jgi:uncharacterized membrane protein YbaN (DUF454 family)
MTRIPYICLGWLMLALGFIGAFVPIMPTTIFLILASWFFARSSPRLEAWLLMHPRFGAVLRAWHAEGAIPRLAKIMACAGMVLGFALFWVGAHPRLWVVLGVAAFFLASAIYVVSRPEPERIAVDLVEDECSCS